jgi:hypothetical protein
LAAPPNHKAQHQQTGNSLIYQKTHRDSRCPGVPLHFTTESSLNHRINNRQTLRPKNRTRAFLFPRQISSPPLSSQAQRRLEPLRSEENIAGVRCLSAAFCYGPSTALGPGDTHSSPQKGSQPGGLGAPPPGDTPRHPQCPRPPPHIPRREREPPPAALIPHRQPCPLPLERPKQPVMSIPKKCLRSDTLGVVQRPRPAGTGGTPVGPQEAPPLAKTQFSCHGENDVFTQPMSTITYLGEGGGCPEAVVQPVMHRQPYGNCR